MFSAVDKPRSFLRSSFTLTGFCEAFLDPAIVVGALFACMALHNERIGPPYVILAILSFSLTFPGDIGFHESPRRAARKLVTNWLLFVAILGGFGYASGYIQYFPQSLLIDWALATPVAVIAGQMAARYALPCVIAMGENQRPFEQKNPARRAGVGGTSELLHEMARREWRRPRISAAIARRWGPFSLLWHGRC